MKKTIKFFFDVAFVVTLLTTVLIYVVEIINIVGGYVVLSKIFAAVGIMNWMRFMWILGGSSTVLLIILCNIRSKID